MARIRELLIAPSNSGQLKSLTLFASAGTPRIFLTVMAHINLWSFDEIKPIILSKNCISLTYHSSCIVDNVFMYKLIDFPWIQDIFRFFYVIDYGLNMFDDFYLVYLLLRGLFCFLIKINTIYSPLFNHFECKKSIYNDTYFLSNKTSSYSSSKSTFLYYFNSINTLYLHLSL